MIGGVVVAVDEQRVRDNYDVACRTYEQAMVTFGWLKEAYTRLPSDANRRAMMVGKAHLDSCRRQKDCEQHLRRHGRLF